MQTRAPIPTWVLVVVSCCATGVAFAFVYVSVMQAREVFAVNPYCAKPAGSLLHTLDLLHTAWLISGIAGVLSWYCALTTHRMASGASRGARRTASVLLVFSSLALVGLVCSFGFRWVSSYSGCFG